jgi:two-component system chemotaxis response regulator CheB
MAAVTPIMASHSRPQVRAMVVDDSVVVRTVIERILNSDPAFSVVHKTNSAEHALCYLVGHEVDLILLDIELPGQSGLSALPAFLRANPHGKVVILSGNCEEGSGAAIPPIQRQFRSA